MLYESINFEESDYTLKFTIKTTATLNCIYYEGTPVFPVPTPSVIPVSISLGQFSNDQHSTIYSQVGNCPTDDLSSPRSYQCGTRVISEIGTFSYKFNGVKFAIIGFKSPELGKFEVEIDSDVVEIDTKNSIHEDFITLYVSDDLDKKEHTLKIKGKRDKYHLHKIVYWPSLTAFRVNITEFNLGGNWKSESDLIGGIRSYTVAGGVDETASKDMRCSKIWVFGSKCQWHGGVSYTIGEISGNFSEYTSGSREDFVMLYESENFKYQVNTLTFVIASTATLNYIYYLDEPPDPTPLPTPEPTPTSEDITNECGFDFKRCKFEKEEQQQGLPSTVHIQISSFSHYNDTLDGKNGGGAIRVTNAGIELNEVKFDKCSSEACGGAIFVENTIDYELPVVFDNLNFDGCQANYGGAIYAHAKTWKSKVVITNCKFTQNRATGSKDDKVYGGSALFIKVINCLIDNSFFINNKGIGGALKVVDASNDQSQILSVNTIKLHSVIITNAMFVIDQDSDCSLFFESGNSNTEYKLIHSTFKGVLGQFAHHIDGIGNKKHESKLVVDKCKFNSNIKDAINFNENNEFVSIDLNNQIFKVNKNQKKLLINNGIA
ncbi:hypothetical protein, partial [uncultured Clostridium sp.]|uniref:hypothetical protein n=1 Tax=uncultured Clostridium sp. TaxID=59620 RepID=UPI002602584C